MKTKLASTLMSIGLAVSAGHLFANEQTGSGKLLAVGGSLTASNAEVYKKFIELSGGKNARIGIVPAASGKPTKYSEWFRDDLVRYGLNASQIEIIPIAVKDESKTEVNEAAWITNAYTPSLARTAEKYTGFWFLGGDQTRITQALMPNGEVSPVLAAIRKAYHNGAVVAGTSAGAAMMSEVMIASGDSMGALVQGFTEEYGSMDEQESGAVYATEGLGFFTEGVIDQHFDRKGRLGRLIVVNDHYKETAPLGFGIDENSAMVYDAKTRTIEAVGYGGVTVVDMRESTTESLYGFPKFTGIRISFLQGGDQYNLATDEFKVNEKKYDTVGYEYIDVEEPTHSGVFARNPNYKDLITYDLVDNKSADEVFSYTLNRDGFGYITRFYQDEKTTGWWNYLDGLRDNYSAIRVLMDIAPAEILVTPIE
jgi:cyanophycinase